MKIFDFGNLYRPNMFYNGKEDPTWFKTDMNSTVWRLGNESYASEEDQWLLWGKHENVVSADILHTSKSFLRKYGTLASILKMWRVPLLLHEGFVSFLLGTTAHTVRVEASHYLRVELFLA